MTFWHNQKYESLEKASKTGDFMRGIPGKQFPWLLKESQRFDEGHDVWNLKITCTKVEAHDYTQQITAYLLLEASCRVHAANLSKIGLGYERLGEIGFSGWDVLTEKCELSLVCGLEKITEKASPLFDMFFRKISTKYSFIHKQNIIKNNIHHCQTSNFS